MFQHFALAVVLLSALLSPLASAACAADRPNELCCRTLAPYSSNAYVYQNICGINESDQSVLMATFCEPAPAGGCGSFHGWFDACCASVATCQSGVDGPVGVDCTGTPIE